MQTTSNLNVLLYTINSAEGTRFVSVPQIGMSDVVQIKVDIVGCAMYVIAKLHMRHLQTHKKVCNENERDKQK